jgi:hypothetical protein
MQGTSKLDGALLPTQIVVKRCCKTSFDSLDHFLIGHANRLPATAHGMGWMLGGKAGGPSPYGLHNIPTRYAPIQLNRRNISANISESQPRCIYGGGHRKTRRIQIE